MATCRVFSIVSRESAFHLYEVKVESRFSRNGPRESGKEKGPGQPKRMLRIYLPTTRSSGQDSRYIIPRKSEKSTESRKGVAVVFPFLVLLLGPWGQPKGVAPLPFRQQVQALELVGSPGASPRGTWNRQVVHPWEPRAPMAPPP